MEVAALLSSPSTTDDDRKVYERKQASIEHKIATLNEPTAEPTAEPPSDPKPDRGAGNLRYVLRRRLMQCRLSLHGGPRLSFEDHTARLAFIDAKLTTSDLPGWKRARLEAKRARIAEHLTTVETVSAAKAAGKPLDRRALLEAKRCRIAAKAADAAAQLARLDGDASDAGDKARGDTFERHVRLSARHAALSLKLAQVAEAIAATPEDKMSTESGETGAAAAACAGKGKGGKRGKGFRKGFDKGGKGFGKGKGCHVHAPLGDLLATLNGTDSGKGKGGKGQGKGKGGKGKGKGRNERVAKTAAEPVTAPVTVDMTEPVTVTTPTEPAVQTSVAKAETKTVEAKIVETEIVEVKADAAGGCSTRLQAAVAAALGEAASSVPLVALTRVQRQRVLVALGVPLGVASRLGRWDQLHAVADLAGGTGAQVAAAHAEVEAAEARKMDAQAAVGRQGGD